MDLQRKKGAMEPILTRDLNCLALHPHENWERIWNELGEASTQDPQAMRIRRFLAANASKAPLDAQGRILIPQRLRQRAHLEREVMIVGVGAHLEVWNQTLFDEDEQEISGDLDRMRTVFAGLGINASSVGGSGGG